MSSDKSLARRLITDELFDFELYKKFRAIASAPETVAILDELIPMEDKHVAFWQKFFGMRIERLGLFQRSKLWMFVCGVRLFGDWMMHLILEAIEIYGVRKYLTLLDHVRDAEYIMRGDDTTIAESEEQEVSQHTEISNVVDAYGDVPLGPALRQILEDELHHEELIVGRLSKRNINPARIRNIFFGFNDGLVEMLGATSGFFTVFESTASVLIASITVAVAGTLSMGAGAFVALGSENEIRHLEERKHSFSGGQKSGLLMPEVPIQATLMVGISYFIGAMVPILPVLFGAQNVIASVAVGGIMIIVVSFILAFLSGMAIRKRIFTNLVIIATTVGITSALGLLVKQIFGVTI
ncbi:MAG: hypothetical protein A3C07_01050 [Candidatus Sungbacteria bacterium RIFCSPHIGHO2_02_FULL_47_11]|uniref:Rubrerythrin family protein n=1 Tax=Candidatus Sungbacteria bacterium RIFCSPHIGHO2_02_FULL_47_11 TaxID=1802270 RepID=A0A1G2KLU8_9BACT|nr:MAG: hypothetical protein A3C07_01050 [Candidatus Sungbacteria bacterium RIFCSPHIGHO2_02_FULL_47_11]